MGLQLWCLKNCAGLGRAAFHVEPSRHLMTQNRLHVEHHLGVSQLTETLRNLIPVFVIERSKLVFYSNHSFWDPHRLPIKVSPSWRPQQTFPRIEEHTLSSQESETKACLSFAQRLEQHWAAPSTLTKSRQASIILMPFLNFCFVFERNLYPLTSTLKSTPLLTLSWFPLLSLKDQVCACILGRERELSQLSVVNGSCSPVCRYQDHHGWGLLWKPRLFMFLSSSGTLLPALTSLPILGPSAVLVPSFILVEPLCEAVDAWPIEWYMQPFWKQTFEKSNSGSNWTLASVWAVVCATKLLYGKPT